MRHRLLDRIAVTAGTLGIAATVSWAGGAVPAFAAAGTFYASPTLAGPGCDSVANACSLAMAIVKADAAGTGSTVMLADGTYLNAHITPSAAINLTAEPGTKPTLTNAGGTIVTENMANLTITGVTFEDALIDLNCSFGALDLEGVDIENTAGIGIVTSGTQCKSVTVNNSAINADTGDAAGLANQSGIFNPSGVNFTINGSTVTASSDPAPVAGVTAALESRAIYFPNGGTLRVANSTVDAESTGASTAGPFDEAYGIVADNDTTVSVTGSTIKSNVHSPGAAGNSYGIDYLDGSAVTLTSSTVRVGATGTGDADEATGIDAGTGAGNLVAASDQFQLTGGHSFEGDTEGIETGTIQNGATVAVSGTQFTETYTAGGVAGGTVFGIDTNTGQPQGLAVSGSSFALNSPAGTTGQLGGIVYGINTNDLSATVSTSTFAGTAAALSSAVQGIGGNGSSGLTVSDTTMSLTAASTDPTPTPGANDRNSSAFDVYAPGQVTLDHDTLGATAHSTGNASNYNFAVGALARPGPITVTDSTVSPAADYTGAAGSLIPAVAVGVISDGPNVTMVQSSTVSPSGTAIGVDSDASYDTAATISARLRVENSTVAGVGGHSVGVATDALQDLWIATGVLPAALPVTHAGLGIEQSTIVSNGQAGVAEDGTEAVTDQDVVLDADILAGNGVDCAGVPAGADQGGNIDDDSTCDFPVNSSSFNHSTTLLASLAPLANNGGPTQTIGLFSASPAINFVSGSLTLINGTFACRQPDQLGVNRPGAITVGAACDAGAVNLIVAPGAGGGTGGTVGGGTPSTETLTLGASPLASVFGQPIAFSAALSPAPNCGTVLWSVDGLPQGSGVPASGGFATLGTVSSLGVGSHTIQATFSPCNGFGSAANAVTVVVGKAATTATVAPAAAALTATVAPTAPGAGTPTGTVTFAVDGAPVGTATLTSGKATLTYSLSDIPHVVSVTYAGDASFTGSSGSASTSNAPLKNPTITAAVTSAKPESASFWYRSAVTVTFTCTAGSSPIATSGCPGPVTLSSSGAAQSVTESVTDTDGGTASVTESPINIDLTSPVGLTLHGVVNHGTYSYAQRSHHVTCTASDPLSGIASCTVTKHTTTTKKYKVVHFTLKATNNAGTSISRDGSYRYRRP
jgi:hypothetical protein